MVFRNIIFSACLVGLVAGLVLTAAQFLGVSPIIFAAEGYEITETSPVSVDGHEHDAEDGHHGESWSPADGFERTAFTLMANVLAGIGFASVLLAIMSQLRLQGARRLTLGRGAVWGLAGFTAFFVVPGLGLPPEIPGTEAAALEHRQLWWLLAVVASGTGLAVLAFAPTRFKSLGLLAIAVPFLIGAPAHEGALFTHPDAEAVAALEALHQRFIVASGLTNLVFWLVLGVLSAALVPRFIVKESPGHVANPA